MPDYSNLSSLPVGATLFGGLMVLMALPAHSEIRLEGKIDAIQLEMQAASIEEALTALGATYGLRFSSATPLNHVITGSFKGPLRRVVVRLLDHYNYVVKTTDGSIEVVVFGSTAAYPQAIGRPVPCRLLLPDMPSPRVWERSVQDLRHRANG